MGNFSSRPIARAAMGTLLIVSLSASTLLSAQIASAAENTCADVTILGARGSGEPPEAGSIPGFGDSASTAAENLTAKLDSMGISHKETEIDYPAVAGTQSSIESGEFNNSVVAGADLVLQTADDTLHSCPSTQLVLMGYSQGAQVMHEASVRLTPYQVDHLAYTWLIADPTVEHLQGPSAANAHYFDETGESFQPNVIGLIRGLDTRNIPSNIVGNKDWEYPAILDGKILEVCHSKDAICNLPPTATAVELLDAVMKLNDEHSFVYKFDAIHNEPTRIASDSIAARVNAIRNSPPPSKMVSTWNTTIAGCKTVTLPLSGNVAGTIEWGDGTQNTVDTANPSHTFGSEVGIVAVTVNGRFSSWGGSWSRQCITEVTEWKNTGTTGIRAAFSNTPNLTKIKEIPSDIRDLSYMFLNSAFSADISEWDTSGVHNMEGMFRGSSFNGNIANWDVSNVTNMSDMFMYSSFNGSLSAWVTSNVRDMSGMFRASSFNGSLTNWDVSNVTDMSFMFYNQSFNGDISGWKPTNVRDMSGMFRASIFNGDISGWRTPNLTNMSTMFLDAQNFNSDMSGWNTYQVTNMNGTFMRATSFNSNIYTWNTSRVTDMSTMFWDASSFNRDLHLWYVHEVTSYGSFSRNLPAAFRPSFG